jgi:hypothetical protein
MPMMCFDRLGSHYFEEEVQFVSRWNLSCLDVSIEHFMDEEDIQNIYLL